MNIYENIYLYFVVFYNFDIQVKIFIEEIKCLNKKMINNKVQFDEVHKYSIQLY